jgi:hypothetical protein
MGHALCVASHKKRRKPAQKLPPVPDYVRYTGGGRRYWRLGGPLTRDREKEALAARRAKQPGRLGRFVLRVLGGGDGGSASRPKPAP